MVFSSSLFLLYFLPVFLIIYFLIGKKLKNIFTLAASILFFAWGAPKFIFIVLASVVIEFYLVDKMNREEGKKRKLWLVISLILNIGLLVYFKYANFLLDNLNPLLKMAGLDVSGFARIALPIGISFFTFQKITYTVDVFRRVHPPLHKPWDYAFYILMFPHLIAGPIVRFNLIADQIEDRAYNENNNNRLTGFFRFCIGLAKKVLIANVLGEQVDQIFGTDPGQFGSYTAWMGILAYAFQIYFDFSGYSDMTIGLARMIGFDFPENFENPYVSQSITEFWRRWHMTLGRFMKDYLYLPMGGNRVSTKRLYLNLWTVFVLSGLWHGAAWNFVLWGIFHGVFLVADRLFLLRFYRWIGKPASIFITFIITLFGWILFRAENAGYAVRYMRRLFVNTEDQAVFDFGNKFYVILLMAAFFSFWGGFDAVSKWQERVFAKNKNAGNIAVMFVVSLIFLLISVGAITSSGFNPFIYFRF